MITAFRLATVEHEGVATVIVEQNGRVARLTEIFDAGEVERLGGRPSDLMPLLEDWPLWSDVLRDRLAGGLDRYADRGMVVGALKFLPPIALPRKLVCIGANYHDHIAEMPIPMTPTYPYAFLMPPSTTLRGSGAAVQKPAVSQMMDWEAELAVVIGAYCRDIAADDALSVVAGYANFNDLSARDWIASRPAIGVDWVRHKAFDGFGPMGPYVLPAEFVPDPQQLAVRLTVNDQTMQDSSTAQMVYGVREIIAHLSSIMTLEPGDVIATGTPAGVGNGRKPPQYLQPGDTVSMEIEGLGVLVTPIV